MCKKKGHMKDNCWWNPENADNKLKKNKHKKFKQGHKKYSNKEITAMIAQLPSFDKNKQKKKKNDMKEKKTRTPMRIWQPMTKRASSLGECQKLMYLAAQMKTIQLLYN